MATTPAIVLASRSPRRAALLRDAGYRFVHVDPPFQDPAWPEPGDQDTPQVMAKTLAVKKAHSVLSKQDLQVPRNAVVLSADTLIVGPDGSLLGQPCDRREAHRMLTLLINATHTVYTGVALIGLADQPSREFADTAWVQLGQVSESQLAAYLDGDQWQGKAGGYNLFDLQGSWPLTVTGDPTTVVGLPMRKLERYLAAWPDAPPLDAGRNVITGRESSIKPS